MGLGRLTRCRRADARPLAPDINPTIQLAHRRKGLHPLAATAITPAPPLLVELDKPYGYHKTSASLAAFKHPSSDPPVILASADDSDTPSGY